MESEITLIYFLWKVIKNEIVGLDSVLKRG